MGDRPACKLCGEVLGKVLLTINEPDRFEKHLGIGREGYERSWVSCPRCGVVSNVTKPEVAAKLRTLSSAYYEIDMTGSSVGEKYRKVMALPPEKSDNANRVARVHDFMRSWLGRLPDHPDGSLAILDVGAGTGVFLARFLEEAAKKGDDSPAWQAVAVEPDPLAAEHLRSLAMFHVVQETIPCPLPYSTFDVCTLNKVLEHLEDPLDLLRLLRPLISTTRGVLYVEVPDRLTILYRQPSDNILGALHHHLYDPTSLTFALETAGFCPIESRRIFEPSGKITVYAFATLEPAVARLAGP